MAIYKYKAFNAKARNISGVIQAESKSDAIEKIKNQSLVLTYIKQENNKKRQARLSDHTLIAFCREMATLLRARLPLLDCLKICQERYLHLSDNTIFVHLVDGINNGHSLSSLLKKYPLTFDKVFIACIQGAESSSRLDKSFDSLHEFLSFKKAMKKELVGICAYPLSLLAFGLLMTFFLLLGFVPQIADLFEGKSLHPISQCVIALSNWLNNSLFLFSSSIAIFSLCIFALAKYKKTSILIKTFFLRFPLVNKIAKNRNMAQVTRLFSLLLGESVPLLDSIRLVKMSYKGSLAYESFARLEEKILSGWSFSKALESEKMFDRVFIQMMKIAQETGELSGMIRQASDIYDLELKTSFVQFKKILQPALLFLLAIVIGFILLATLLPLTDAANIL